MQGPFSGNEKQQGPWAEKQSAKKKIIAFILLIAIGTFAVFVLMNKQIKLPEIIDYHPKAGAAGSHVYVLFEDSIDVYKHDLRAYYNGRQIFIADIQDDLVEVITPLDAGAGKIEFRYAEAVSEALDFSALNMVSTLVYSELLQPSNEMQIVNHNEEIKLAIPSGLFDTPREVTLSVVENVPPNNINTLNTTAIDISIEGLTELDEIIEIAVLYDKSSLDPNVSHDKQLMAMRYDKDHKQWIPLPMQVDEETSTMYVETDHLSLFSFIITVPSGGAVAVTIVKTGVGVAAVATTARIAEAMALSSYSTENFKFLYNKKSMDIIYKDWQKPDDAQGLVLYSTEHPYYIQDMAELFEVAFANYIDVRGYRNPTTKVGAYWSTKNNPIIVKMGGVYSTGSGLVNEYFDPIAGGEEPMYGKVFGAIHLPLMFFEHPKDVVYTTIGHELFHAIQSQYYNFYKFLEWTKTGDYWWLEATAEYAGVREAWGLNNKEFDLVLDRGVRGNYFSFPMNSTGEKSGWGKEYEYASANFIKYLVDKRGIDFKDLFEFVSQGEPFARLDQYLRNTSDASRSYNLAYDYLMFARWGIFSSESYISNQDIATVADKIDMLELAADNSLQIEVEAGSDVWFEIFRSDTPDRATVWDYNIPHIGMGLQDTEAIVEDLKKGEVVYVLAVNNDEQDKSVQVTAKLSDAADADNAASSNDASTTNSTNELAHTFNLPGFHTAKVWAIQIIGDASLTITPNELLAAQIGEEYTFTLTANNIPLSNGSKLEFEWDFGDNKQGSTASKKDVIVQNGRASIEVKYTYEQAAEKYTLLTKVKDGATGNTLAQAEADVVFDYAVRILGDRNIGIKLSGTESDRYEYEHQFEASVQPADAYLFVWDFGDGITHQETKKAGENSKISHKYTGIKAGDKLTPTVKIFDTQANDRSANSVLAEDSILITVEQGDSADLIYFYGQQEVLYEVHAFEHEFAANYQELIVHFMPIDLGGTFEWDFGDGSPTYTHPANVAHDDVRSDISLREGYLQVAIPHTFNEWGNNIVTVKMYGANGTLLGQTSKTVINRRIEPGSAGTPNYDWIPAGD